MENIIVDTEERFIGIHKEHRISVIKVDDMFEVDVQDKTNVNIMKIYALFENIQEAIQFSVDYLNRNLN